MKSGFNFFSRKVHRYLGLFIGIQFLLWTLGGLYFSWTNITEIRGEHLRKESEAFPFFPGDLLTPDIAIAEIKKHNTVVRLEKVELVVVRGEYHYEIIVSDEKGTESTFLVNSKTGKIRGQFGKDEAIVIATEALVKKSKVAHVELLTFENVGSHHEYREKPLPAYAVTFENPADLTVYVAANTGRVESFRTNRWRVFDFLWMLHTMDYTGRDNINNYVLRGFSILGILTILSGFVLFFVTSPVFRRKKLPGYKRSNERN